MTTPAGHDPAGQAPPASAGPSLREAMPGLVGLLLAGFLAVTTELLPVGVLPAIGEAFDVSESVAGLLVSVYAVMVAVLAVPLTILTRRLPRRPLLLGLLAAYAVSNAIVAAAPTFEVVAAGRALGGVTHALFFSVSIGYAARLVGRAWVGRAMAIVATGITAGLVAGVPLMTSLATATGWREAFAVMAVFAVLVTLGIARILPPVGNAVPERDAVSASRRGALAAAVAANGLTYLGYFTLYTYVALLLLGSGAGEAAVGPILLGFGSCGLLGLWFAGRTLDHRPRVGAATIVGVMCVAIVGVGVGYPSLWAVLGAGAAWGVAVGGTASLFQAAAVRTHATSGEMAGAWINASSNVGIAGGAAIGAALLGPFGVGGLPWVAAALVGAALVVVVTARRAFPAAA